MKLCIWAGMGVSPSSCCGLRLRSSFAGHDPVVLGENKGATKSQSFPSLQKHHHCPREISDRSCHEVRRSGLFSLQNSGGVPCGVVWTVLGCPETEAQGLSKTRPDQGDQDTERAGDSFLEGRKSWDSQETKLDMGVSSGSLDP